MSNEDYRIDFDSSNPIEAVVDLSPQAELMTAPRPPTATAAGDVHSNDHLHQFIQFVKDNLTSTFPFALILILKAFYEHSAGQ